MIDSATDRPAVKQAPRRPSPLRWLQRVPSGVAMPANWASVTGPALFAAISIALLAYNHVQRRVTDAAFWLGLALVTSIFLWLVGRASAAVSREYRSALTDDLTRLPNRSQLQTDLTAAVASSTRERWVVVLVDVDGLPAYNDRHGQAAGDELLLSFARGISEIAAALAGNAYRAAGGGFAVLARPGARPPSAIAAAVIAAPLERTDALVDTSYGEVTIPDEASDAERALKVAAQRLAARRQRQRGSVRGQLRDVLLAVVTERQRELGDNAPGVAYWTIAVGRELGLEPDQLDDIALAAELRDIGLLGVPELLLEQGTVLTERDRGVIRQHPIAGERIVAAAPALASVAALVRGANEHFGGGGYPDGIAGTTIPLGARIIAVCAEFAALTSSRAQDPGIGVYDALSELDRRSGAQFDPAVVRALASVISETPTAPRARGEARSQTVGRSAGLRDLAGI